MFRPREGSSRSKFLIQGSVSYLVMSLLTSTPSSMCRTTTTTTKGSFTLTWLLQDRKKCVRFMLIFLASSTFRTKSPLLYDCTIPIAVVELVVRSSGG